MAKIPAVFNRNSQPTPKETGDGANSSPTGPTQPGGSAAGQPPAPFLQNRRNQIVAALLLLGVLLILPIFGMSQTPSNERELSEVLTSLPKGEIGGQKIASAAIDDDNRVLQLILSNGDELQTSYPNQFGTELVKELQAAAIPFTTEPIHRASPVGALLTMLLPVLMIIGFFVWMSKKGALGGAPNAKAFTATKAELPEPPAARFTDVVGCDEAVEELSEIVSFLHDPTHFDAAGAHMPRGFLLVGPPGTGKTLLARAVAGEAGVPFYSAAGSDFSEMFVGVGAARVRNLFAKAKKTGGIIFLDELDSIGRARTGTTPGSGGTDERESTLNALLVEMDGFGKDSNVIVIAATNRPDVLDSALLRAGRFDRQVTVSPPDRKGRTRLLELYTADHKTAADVDFVALARRMPGLTGADISNLVNQAAMEAARANRDELCTDDFAEALATVMMGRARRSATVTDRDREITAWHEAGHAVVALVVPEAHDPVQVTIVPRGGAGGVTWMGGDDAAFLTGSEARARLVVSLAGRAAEEILLDGDFTQGASSDIASATNLAQRMVAEWGMSGLGRLAAVGPEHAGSALVERVHAEADGLLTDALVRARTLLVTHRPLLEALVADLLADETIDLDRMQELRNTVEAAPVG